ncbi:MAG TPA: HDOD domain-containing protein, partial [Firmicutes bacterium]|nr:HDOD domain-containing protein [Bacillota bacterium]
MDTGAIPMLPVLLFGIILIVAAAALIWYSLPPFAFRRQNKNIEPAEDKYTSIMLPPPSGKSTKLEEKIESIKDKLNPDDAGIHHDMEIISDSGWSDLEFVLDELGRDKPSSAAIIGALRNPEIGEDEFIEVCARHAGLAARILDLVNASFYEILEPVYDLKRASSLLGTSEIRRLAFIAGLFDTAKIYEGPIASDALWTHSLATARISSWLSARVIESGVQIRTELAGMASVVHDAGKIVLKRWRPEKL